MLSSFYDLWSLTSRFNRFNQLVWLWIAFKFLWSLVFDIIRKIGLDIVFVVNCFQVFMIFGLWHLNRNSESFPSGCELLSSFYDLWSLTSRELHPTISPTLWIAFKFLWSLVFDIPLNEFCLNYLLWIAFKFLWSLVFDISIRPKPQQQRITGCH